MNPTGTTFGLALAVIASLAGDAVAAAPAATLPARDRWSQAEIEVLASLRLSELPPTPVDPSNAVELSPAAIALGKRLFNDARFSRNQAVSCATCHDPAKHFQDGRPLALGVAVGSRRAMPIKGTGHNTWLFWDGRKDSLWSQALGPLEDAVEHGGNRVRYGHLIQAHYAGEYAAVFGTTPELPSAPHDAGPNGSAAERAAWAALDAKAQRDFNRVFANLGKAIAAFEKTLTHDPSRFDRYVEGIVAGDTTAQQHLTPQEVRGLRTFIGKGQCVDCHNGPLLTDQAFHNTGVPPRDPTRPDLGRAAAIAKVQQDEFNCLGPYSDAAAEQCETLRFMVTDPTGLEAAFKTPSLRDVAARAPYMHAGQIASLEDVITHYTKAPDAVVGRSELARVGGDRSGRKPIRLSEREIRELASFLATLDGIPTAKTELAP